MEEEAVGMEGFRWGNGKFRDGGERFTKGEDLGRG